MIATARRHSGSSTIAFTVVGLVLVAAYLVAFFLLIEGSTYDIWGAMLVGPVLFVLALPVLSRQARREGDARVFWLLTLALAVKFGFSVFRYYHGFYVVNGADARGYDDYGTDIALRFLDGDFGSGLENLTESNFVRFFTGLIYTVIRPSALSGFLIYAWLAFWGTYFFYRAFVLALPEGGRLSYARWLFFMPSILFWPSSIGKESLLVFGLGIAAFGAAKVTAERVLPGLAVCAIGLGFASLVRTPAAVAMGVGLMCGGLLRRPSVHLRQLRPIARLVSFALFSGIAVVIAMLLVGYLERSAPGRAGGSNVETLIAESRRVTSTGGSEFEPVPITSPTGLVIVPVTVLFRPFPFEANNGLAVLTSIEASVLLLFSVMRIRSIWAAVTSIRRSPYIAVALGHVAASIVSLSPVANFGIIARQRTLIYPMYLVLLCAGARRREKREPTTASAPAEVQPVAAVGGRT